MIAPVYKGADVLIPIRFDQPSLPVIPSVLPLALVGPAAQFPELSIALLDSMDPSPCIHRTILPGVDSVSVHFII